MQLNLQERILTVVRENQPLREPELAKWLSDVDPILLDVGVRALMRANKVSLTGGYYDLLELERPASQKPRNPVAVAVSAPPTAAEEAATSLQPTSEPLFECALCPERQPDSSFRHRKDGSQYPVCKTCHGKRMARGREAMPAKKVAPPAPAVRLTGEHLRPAEEKPRAPKVTFPLPKVSTGLHTIRLKREELVDAIKEYEDILTEKRRQLADLDHAVEALQTIVPEAFA